MYSAPKPLLESYWHHYQNDLAEEFNSFDEFADTILREDKEAVENMATFLYQDKYQGMDPGEFENRAGMQQWRDEQPTWLEVVGSKIAKRGMDLGAGMATTIDTTAAWLESKIPLGALDLDKMEWRTGEEHARDRAEGRGKSVFEVGSKALRDAAPEYGYEDRVSWEEFKESPVEQFIQFALEHGLASLPDMVAAVANLPGYVLSRTGEIATERREADTARPEGGRFEDVFRARLEEDEGYEEKTYRDTTGHLTYGYGHKVLPGEPEYDQPVGTPVPKEKIEATFQKDMEDALDDARSVFSGFDELPRTAQVAIASMAFQMGRQDLAGFKKFKAAVEAEDWETASKEMLDSKWATQTPNRAERLASSVKGIAQEGQEPGPATVEDLLYSFPTAVGVSILERIGAAKVFGITDTIKEATIKEIWKAGLRRAGAEGATEAVQEPAEAVGTNIGTKRWEKMTPEQIAGELLERSAQGAVVGTGFGGGAGTAVAGYQAARGRTAAPEAEPDIEAIRQEAEDKAENVASENIEALEKAAEAKRQAATQAAMDAADEADAAAAEEEGTAPAEPSAIDAFSDADRTVESMQLEEEAKLGKRRPLRPQDVQPGDRVTVDDGTTPPETGTVETADDRLVRIVDEAGSPIAVIRLDAPADTDPMLYSATAPEEVDTDLEAAAGEMARLIKRTQADPTDKGALDSLRKLRNGPEFQKLSPEQRDALDDHLRDVDRAAQEAVEAEKAAKKAEEEEAKRAAKAEEEPGEKQVGMNAQGNPIMEDERGVRSYVEGGIQITEPVQLIPTREGMSVGVDKERRGDEFLTDDERAARAEPEAPLDAGQEVSEGGEAAADVDLGATPSGAEAAPPPQAETEQDAAEMEALREGVEEATGESDAEPLREEEAQQEGQEEGALPPVEAPEEVAAPIQAPAAAEPAPAPEPEAAPAEEQPTDRDAPGGPVDQLADRIDAALEAGETFNNPALFRLADEVFGGSVGAGTYDAQDAYNAVELAVNKRIAGMDLSEMTLGEARGTAQELVDLTAQLPTQTRRTGEKVAFQQFSTPPAYAFAANYAAGVRDGDTVLEPSAGMGALAVVARSMGGKVSVNELSPKRAAGLRMLGFDATNEDAEQIANIMEPESFDLVVMNPPFSAAGARGVKNTNAIGGRHVAQAARMLKPGGRLVAIMGEGFTPQNRTVAGLFKRLSKEGQFRAVFKIDGKVYRKYGTTFDNQLIIYDKTGAAGDIGAVKRGEFDSIPDLLTALEEVRNARPVAQDGGGGAVQGPGEPGPRLPGDTGVSGTAAGPPAPSEPGDAGLRDEPVDGRPDGGDIREDTDEEALGGGGESVGAPGDDAAGPGGAARSGPGGERSGPGIESVEAEAGRIEEEENSAFAAYKPALVKIKGAKTHPAKLVETTAMATVRPPPVTYVPSFDQATIDEGRLSDAQLEAITYAGAAHGKVLPDGRRRGYFIGDGTGVGKGREVAGMILDNWNQGRRKAVWVSKDKKLLEDAKRDVSGVGLEAPIHDLTGSAKVQKMQAGEGIAFTTYSTLRSAGTAEQKRKKQKRKEQKFPNVQKLAAWLGKEFDGIVAFDESHVMANIMPGPGGRSRKPSQVAQAGLYLQELLPNARVVYVSATGATEVTNLGYLDRLGLWGEGTAFSDVQTFTEKIAQGGVATMELVARDMKQMGLYSARSISFEGVEYDNVIHPLTPPQREMYDVAARAWQLVLNNMDAAIEVLMPGSTRQEQRSKMQLSFFWGSCQRFFNQFLTSLQMPSVIKSIETDITEGRAPVVQLTNTNEAATTRAVAGLEEGQTLDDIDITPRQTIIDFVDAAFPTQQMQQVLDDLGNEIWVPVLDSEDRPMQNEEAVRMKNEMIAELGSLQLPGNPLDMILEHFGFDSVSEITGRSKRIVTGAEGKKEQQPRSNTARLKEIADFQDGKRDVLVFSAAGGTGASYHADIDAENQKRRSHYVLQAGWKADEAIQGFGRTHRSNEANQPLYRLVQTDLPAHKRFVATIARRLDQLGALTKGQREASSTALFSATDNLENEYAAAAVYALFEEIRDGSGIMSLEEAYQKMGIHINPDTPLKPENVPVHRFLNRLLSLEIADQDRVFDEFADKLATNIEAAIEAGTYETGIETMNVLGAEVLDRQTVFSDEETGAETEYVQVEIEVPNIPNRWNRVKGHDGSFVLQKQSGRIYFMEEAQPRTDPRTGIVTPRTRRWGANSQTLINTTEARGSKYAPVKDRAEAERLWNEQVAQVPRTRKSTVHLMTGALLPVYDRIKTDSKKVTRIPLSDGNYLLGRVLTVKDVAETLKNFGTKTTLKKVPATEMLTLIHERNASAELSNGVKLRQTTVSGEPRVEMIGTPYGEERTGGLLDRMGFQKEFMNYRTRVFVPSGADGAAVLGRYLKGKDVVSIVGPQGEDLSNEVKYSIAARNPRALAERHGPEIEAEIREIAARLVPGARVKVQQGMVQSPTGGLVQGTFISGNADWPALIEVSLQASNPRAVMRHEAIHALKNLGLFTSAEWSALEHAAENGKWLEKHRIRERYPGFFHTGGAIDGLMKPEWKPAAIEEAIADEFAAWASGKPDAARSPVLKRIMARIYEFFRALTEKLRGYGATPTPGNIFDAVERGEVATRVPAPGRRSRGKAASVRQHRDEPDSLVAEFGLKADNVPEADRPAVRQTLRALADAFYIPYRAMGMGGRLTLGLKEGGTTTGEGVYRRAERAIGLKKWADANGVNHAAIHEWWHALDHEFGNRVSFDTRTPRGPAFESLPPDYNFMTQANPGDLRNRTGRFVDWGNMRRGTLDAWAELVDAFDGNKPEVRRQLDRFRERSRNWMAENFSDTVARAQSEPLELSARVFEMLAMKRIDPDGHVYRTMGKHHYWPTAKEADAFETYFDNLFLEMSTRETWRGQGLELYSVAFPNAETEERWQEAAKGVQPSSLANISAAIVEEWQKLTRARRHMPERAEFSDAREKMIHLEQAGHAAKEKIAAFFNRVMGGLNAEDIDLLTRKMVLDDLLWSSSEGMDLPFGLKGTGDVLDALHGVEAALEGRPDLKERLQVRSEYRDGMTRRMVGAKVLTPKQAKNPHYFRHQVLEYAALRDRAVPGRKVRSTYWHARRGSEKDINANYFQAEADWLFKAEQDIATARFLQWQRRSQYNRKGELVQRAKADNNEALQARMLLEPELGEAWGKKSRNIAIAMQKLRRDLGRLDGDALRTQIPGELHRQLDAFLAGGGDRAATDDGGNAPVFGLIQHLADSQMEGVNQKAGVVLAAVRSRRKFLRDTLGDAYVNPQDIPGLVKRYLPDTHEAWQADSFDGKQRKVHIYTGKTVAQHVLDRALDDLSGIVGEVLTEEQVEQVRELLANQRDARMVGGPMEEIVLPKEIVATLNEFYDEGITGAVDGVAVWLTGRWKQWVLFNPARFAKYYLNNLTGDTDALLATKAGSGVRRKLPQAWREVRAMIRDNEIAPMLAESLERGVVQSSLVMQEVVNMGPLADDAFRPEKVTGVLKAGSAYFKKVQNIARLRENAFRHAAYLHYRDEFAQGKSLMEIGYGASPPWMVEGITDRQDKAARMARDLLGDYGSIPERARWARKRVIPFVSWLASNTTRYNNLFRNAWLTGRDVSKTRGAVMGAYTAAGLAARIFLFYGMVQLWNHLLFEEEEELLGTEERLRLHAILGRWGGEVVTLRFQGALSDYLGWMGLEDAGATLSEVLKGRASVPDVVGEIAKAPFNKVAQGVTPLYKLPVEVGLGQQFWPDIFNPRSVRDRTRHFARTFSLDYPTAQIKRMLGEPAPTRGPLKTAASAIVYMKDPGQMAYDQILGKAFQFIERETGSSVAGQTGGRSDALYNYRLARRRGDDRSARLAREELRQYGRGGRRSLRSSLGRASPLGMFPNKRLRRQFMRTLSKRERDTLKRAQLWYRETMR